MQTTKEYAQLLDSQDPLASFRQEFYIQPGVVYMDGNSLGLLSKRAEQALLDMLESWKQLGIDGWLDGKHPWFYVSEQIGALLAPLAGAAPEEVIAAGSTTVNLHQLAATFYEPQETRTKILASSLDFPTDIYALQSQLRLKGYNPDEHLLLIESRDGRTIWEEDIIAAMNEEVALAILPCILYRSGQVLDMQRLTAAAHERGILIGFDACHSIGAIPHRFSEWGTDFAFWCNYKYINGGPGSTAGLYVNRRHFGRLPGLTGWFGSDKEKQFNMEHTFSKAEGAGAYQLGTPHILSSAPLLGSLELFREAGMDRVRQKSLLLTSYMLQLIRSELHSYGFTVGTPEEEERRGGHVALEHPEAARICKALKQAGVVPDYRAPDIIRLAPAALYTSFADVWAAVAALKEIMEKKQYEAFPNERNVVA
ncbi:kynureninase [Ectobacillus ponti]|uniref:Kynureninase n=1 Tax=Ectobacillus ponti TaxID=2961894 RepID=A0AA41XCC4_9BACI|nr:kynureninase [Ectobacillus ponti]MCP8970729.1 kynureninase [Ectobacillus ponti]